jgi:hypothetical protein
MRKAIVENEKVINIIEYTGGRLTLEVGQLAVDCEQYPVAIGDDCIDWRFYRDGELLERIPTLEERNAQLEAELLQTQLALAEIASLIGGAE